MNDNANKQTIKPRLMYHGIRICSQISDNAPKSQNRISSFLAFINYFLIKSSKILVKLSKFAWVNK